MSRNKETDVKTDEMIIRTDYSEIMQKNYIDYAMSVIVSRALPDVRDGLKPVQRRVLYDMWELGTRYDRPYRKSARIVGDTMGKYHPHGDSSIYDALVVLAQSFKKGRVLVDGHGNFGSIEGDGAAAMRYTEARLEKFTQDVFLSDLDKDLVSFVPNFDETEKEPEVLPSRVPNILINGSEGIAVGMATSIPPHNIGEVIEAVQAFIKDDSLSSKDLMKYIKGPDFPTGGLVVNSSDLEEIYSKGQGKLRVRGRVEIEKGKGGRVNIVITEIPYTMIGAGIGRFMSDTAALVETRQTGDIVDISNQSSKEGIRIVIECKKGTDTDALLNLLYKKTKLEDTFGVNMLVVSDGRPETMSLKELIEASVDFQFEIADRKYENLLAKELERKEIQEGLIRAVDVIDLIIEILRGSKSRKMAVDCLVMGKTEGIRFKSAKSEKAAKNLMFTERQANAILDMRLVKLIGLELDALMAEHEETLKKIALYRNLLEDHMAMSDLLISELEELKKEYGVERKTLLTEEEQVVLQEKAVEEEEVIFLLDRFGYARTIDVSTYEKNLEAAEADKRAVFRVLNTDRIGIITDTGKLHSFKVLDLPQTKLRDKGIPVDNLSNFSNKDERILTVMPVSEIAQSTLFLATEKGFVKQTKGEELISGNRTVQATRLQEDDMLVYAGVSDHFAHAVLISKKGYFLKFPISEASILKKNAYGVKGMTLSDGDTLDSVHLIENAKECVLPYKNTKVSLNRLKLTKRGGKGNKK